MSIDKFLDQAITMSIIMNPLWKYLDGNLDVLLAEVCDVHLGQEVRSPQRMVMYMMVNKIFPFFSTSEIPAHSWQCHSMHITWWPECHVFPHLEHINVCLNTKLCQNETPAGRLELLAPRRLRRDWLLNVGVDTLEEEGGTVDTGVGEPLCGYSGFLELAQWSRRCSWWLTCLAG